MQLLEQAAIFRKAAMLIKKGFTKGSFARNAEQEAVTPHNPSACSFCTMGAIRNASGFHPATPLLNYAESELQRTNKEATGFIAGWNDAPDRTKEEVVGFLRNCAKRLQKQAKQAL